MSLTTCRKCGDQTHNLSGFCDKGICSLVEEGYYLGFREAVYGREDPKAKQDRGVRAAQS